MDVAYLNNHILYFNILFFEQKEYRQLLLNYPVHRTGQRLIKLNCDGAVGPNHAAIVVVARDWRGSLVFSLSKKVYYTNIPIQAEAKALRWSVYLAMDKNFSNDVFESDSQICIRAISQVDTSPPWRIQGLISDIKARTQNFHSATFSWVYREANTSAHLLSVWSLKNSVYGSFAPFCGPSNFASVISREAEPLAVVQFFFVLL